MKINLNDYIIDERIFTVKFKCDLMKCKGACCTMKGDEGAPLLDEEINLLRKNLPAASKYLAEENIRFIEEEGFFLKGSEGKFYTNVINDEDCAFVFYENEIAKCSFEKAFFNGETDFRKPVSCHLFPIRIKGSERNMLRYEKISECDEALDAGSLNDVTIFEFLKDSLIREFGKEFYFKAKEKFLNKVNA